MDSLRKLVNHFKERQEGIPKASEELFSHLEQVFFPHLLRVIQKDNTLLSEVELFPGVKAQWTGSDEEWKLLFLALFSTLLQGNPKEKIGKVLETLKGAIPGMGATEAQASEIETLLADDETQNSMSELLELILSTRLLTVVTDMLQSLDLTDLGLDFDDPEEVVQLLRNPQNSEVLTKLMDRAKSVLEDRIKTGKIDPHELQRDIETVRAKFQSSFGKYLNETLLGVEGNTTGNTAQQILSNHPDARRARMLARLQKRQQEKLRKGR
jgi:hypothetical protein